MPITVEFVEGRERKFLEYCNKHIEDCTLYLALGHLESHTVPELSALIADPNDPPGQIYDEIHKLITLLIEDWGEDDSVASILVIYPENGRELERQHRWDLGLPC